MQTVPLKLVTIVAEALLEDRIIQEVKTVGAKGYSVSAVRGEGSRGIRASDWEGSNVKIETIVSPEVADRLIEQLTQKYFPVYAVIAYVSDVSVVRGDKYV